jgi:hypothetical protein
VSKYIVISQVFVEICVIFNTKMPEIFRLALCVYIREYCPKSTKSHHNQHDDYIFLFF